ncbi:MAG: energy-coupling factor ABC transporter permease [Muribaculaceae bacterium]|nr:energy-coupling factor ABC transporter permease [Muribaculaceae bacterium]
MHLADALISTPVALVGGAISAALLGVAGVKVKKKDNSGLIPLMGVMGAFIFAAQMVNFAIPGTGSSGHIVGGILLAAILGPWAAFLTLTSVLIIQCLIFADGGLLALGCNILNMAVMTTLVAYPLVFKPLEGTKLSFPRLIAASVAASVVGLELGAFAVSTETVISGVTALPYKTFLTLMLSIHLAIGICEGVATAAILSFIAKNRPEIIYKKNHTRSIRRLKSIIIGFAIATVIIGGGIAFLASSNPDGLEWSIQQITGSTELSESVSSLASGCGEVQGNTAILPDYENSLSGIIGSIMVLVFVWALTALFIKPKKSSQ